MQFCRTRAHANNIAKNLRLPGPISYQLLARLEERIFTMARPGTIILAPYNTSLRPRPDLDGAKVADPVFIAGVSQREADDLRRKAEYTGLEIVRRPRDFPFDTGFWSPILEAAQFNGG